MQSTWRSERRQIRGGVLSAAAVPRRIKPISFHRGSADAFGIDHGSTSNVKAILSNLPALLLAFSPTILSAPPMNTAECNHWIALITESGFDHWLMPRGDWFLTADAQIDPKNQNRLL